MAATPDLAVLTAAVTAAGLTNTLAGPGPLTLFAPTDQAFGRLAPATVAALLRPENRATAVKLLKLHLVAGALSASDLTGRIVMGGGHATLTSLAGEPLDLSMTETVVTLTDGEGNRSYVEVADRRQANGVIHVVNGVLIPRLD